MACAIPNPAPIHQHNPHGEQHRGRVLDILCL
jgi:hypothetical protein